eukprot:Phypoly_transcript_08400.p1 GENE.Phypoly_transcript_08400~~Phypoly_transcript_08400.p1  ORF type:complete len:501 (+),score=85.46 Phypoly_transcript_08400:219-1505(+)
MKSREDAKLLAQRAILLKDVYELWGEGETYAGLIESLKSLPDQEILEGLTWKMDFTAFGRGYVREEQLEKMHSLKGVPFLEKGKVKMKNPDKVLCLIEDVGIRKGGEPRRVYFGDSVCEGNRDLIFKYNLKKRPFLGTTTMDPELSLISANMGKARPGTLIYDPFVGTGSLLLACAHFGAHVIGADIDIRTLRNNNPKMRVEANFEHAGLSQYYTGIILGDNSRTPLRPLPIFDAIVTDPPYGIRAGARKVGKKTKKKWKPVPQGFHQAHFPQCINYKVSDVLRDLLSLAARQLRIGGRLVYWLPSPTDYSESDLPLHPCLKIIANSPQIMSSLWSRRLITMEKIKDYSSDLDKLDPSVYGQLTSTHDKLRDVVFFSNRPKEGGEGTIAAPLANLNFEEDSEDEEEEEGKGGEKGEKKENTEKDTNKT